MQRIQATRGKDYLFVYTAEGKPFTVVLDKIEAAKLKAYWYDPRNGKTTNAGEFSNTSEKLFTPPNSGYGHDWVLIVDDALKYKALE